MITSKSGTYIVVCKKATACELPIAIKVVIPKNVAGIFMDLIESHLPDKNLAPVFVFPVESLNCLTFEIGKFFIADIEDIAEFLKVEWPGDPSLGIQFSGEFEEESFDKMFDSEYNPRFLGGVNLYTIDHNIVDSKTDEVKFRFSELFVSWLVNGRKFVIK